MAVLLHLIAQALLFAAQAKSIQKEDWVGIAMHAPANYRILPRSRRFNRSIRAVIHLYPPSVIPPPVSYSTPPSRSCDFLRRWITRSRQEPCGCLACICIIVHANSMQTTCRKVTMLRRPCNFNCNFASLNLSSESKSRQVSLTCKFIPDVYLSIVN